MILNNTVPATCDDERDTSAQGSGPCLLGGPNGAAVTTRSHDLADLPITISRFRNARDNVPVQEDMTWGDLVAHLSHHEVRVSKDGPGFSPVSYKPGTTRSTVGVEQIFCAVADVDSGISPEQFLEQFPPDLEALLVSTYRSTPEHPKFRAITPLVTPCAASDWPRGWDSLQENVWHGASDEHTKDAGRFYYLASHAPEATPFVVHRPGKALDLAGLPHVSEGPREEGGSGDSSDWSERLDLEPYLEAIPEGQRNDGIFRLACSLRARGVEYEVAKLAVIGAASKCEVGNDPFPEEEALGLLDRAWAKYEAPVLIDGSALAVNSYDTSEDDKDDGAPMPFPVDALPEPVARYVCEAAAATVAPPEYIAVPFLVAAGAVIGNRLELVLKKSWREGANLYAACVGTPGSKKSPAMKVALKPLLRLQAKLAKAHGADLEKWKVEHQAWKDEKDAQKPEPTRPTFPHLLATDATVEALVPMLAGSPGILLHMDELVAWVRAMNQYKQGGKGADRQHYLSFWSRATVKVDRRGRIHEPVMVECPSLSVVGGIQPDLLPSLTDAAGDDGFLDRLLWADPDPLPCRWTDDDVSNSATKGVVALFEMLNGLPYAIGAYDDQASVRVSFTPQAKDRWVRWYEQHGAEADAVPSQLAGVWNKLPSQLARIALILHALDAVRPAGGGASGLGAADGSPRSIVAFKMSLDTLEAAITILDYFKAHARRVYGRMYGQRGRGGDRRAPTSGGADTVRARVMKALGTTERLSENDLLRGVLGGHVKSAELLAVLEDLEAEGTIVREVVPGRGRPTTYWRLVDSQQEVQDAAA